MNPRRSAIFKCVEETEPFSSAEEVRKHLRSEEDRAKEQLLHIPLSARVAFVARCARRVQPVFQAGWPSALQEHVAAIDLAIEFAETAAATGECAFNSKVVFAALGAMIAAECAGASSAAQAAAAAAFAAKAAIGLADATGGAQAGPAGLSAAAALFSPRDTSVGDAVESHVAARLAAFSLAGPQDEEKVRACLQEDYDRLHQAATRENWNDRTPVPTGFFGPLWPKGSPKNWPTGKDSAKLEPLEQEPTISPAYELSAIEKEVIESQKEHVARFRKVLEGLEGKNFDTADEKRELVTRINRLCRTFQQQLVHDGLPVTLHCVRGTRIPGAFQLRHEKKSVYSRVTFPKLVVAPQDSGLVEQPQ